MLHFSLFAETEPVAGDRLLFGACENSKFPLRKWNLNSDLTKSLHDGLVNLCLCWPKIRERHPRLDRDHDRRISQRGRADTRRGVLQDARVLIENVPNDIERMVEVRVIG